MIKGGIPGIPGAALNHGPPHGEPLAHAAQAQLDQINFRPRAPRSARKWLNAERGNRISLLQNDSWENWEFCAVFAHGCSLRARDARSTFGELSTCNLVKSVYGRLRRGALSSSLSGWWVFCGVISCQTSSRVCVCRLKTTYLHNHHRICAHLNLQFTFY
jgi:hypothetical protein